MIEEKNRKICSLTLIIFLKCICAPELKYSRDAYAERSVWSSLYFHTHLSIFQDILKTVGLCSKVLFNAFTHMLEAICLHGNIENLENFMSNLGFGLFEESESVLQKRGLLGNLRYVLYLR